MPIRRFHFFRDLSLSKKITFALVGAVVVALAVSGVIAYRSIGEEVELMLGLRLEHIARTASLVVPSEVHHQIVQDYLAEKPSPEQTPHFKKMQSVLRAIQLKNELSSDIYTVIRTDFAPDDMIFIAMGSDTPYIGNAMPLNRHVERVLAEGKPTHSKLYEDKEGVWVSAFAPLFSPQGKAEAVIEVDYRADKEVRAAKVALFQNIAISALGGLVIAVVVGGLLGKALSQPVIQLSQAAEKVAGGDLTIQVVNDAKDQVGVLAKTFNEMVRNLKANREALEDYARNLEKKVQERTAELRDANRTITAMVDSVGQGFFVFDKSGNCLPIYTKACEPIFNMTPAGKPVSEVLRQSEDAFKEWWPLLFEEPIPFEDLKGLGPTLLPEATHKKVTLEYYPLRNEDGKISGVVVVGTDKTKEAAAEIEAQKEKAYARMVSKMARHRGDFLAYLRAGRELLPVVLKELERANPDMPLVQRHLHTLKGGAGTLSIQKLQKMAHEAESALVDVVEAKLKVGALLQSLEAFIVENQAFLGKGLEDSSHLVEVSAPALVDFASELRDFPVPKTVVARFLERFAMEPMSKFFEPYGELVLEVGGMQNKLIEPLRFHGDTFRVYAPPFLPLFAACVHAFRNAVDHGLETPEERQSAGKSASGSIVVHFQKIDSERGSEVEVVIQDDGRGISLDAIRNKLKKMGRESLAEEPEHELLQHVFDSGFSTRDAVSELSGRGAGLDAVKETAQQLGGSVEILTELGKGTQLKIRVPIPDPLSQKSENSKSMVG